MQKYNALCQIKENVKTAVALGYFDGVHMGHRKVIEAAIASANENKAESAVFTFNLQNYKAHLKGDSIFTKQENERRIQSLGIGHYYCPEFEEFCEFKPEEFVRIVLFEKLHAKYVFCGQNFKFGKNKSGDVNVLKELCYRLGIKVTVLETSMYNGNAVSSTRIRQCLKNGDLQSANGMLCSNYSINLIVKHGEKIGKTLGFPTVNQVYESHMAQLKSGVYITSTTVRKDTYASATGIGNRPTFGGESTTCETFIIDFNDDIYGESIDVTFHEYLKPTVKFESKKELEEYIRSAVVKAKEYFNAP